VLKARRTDCKIEDCKKGEDCCAYKDFDLHETSVYAGAMPWRFEAYKKVIRWKNLLVSACPTCRWKSATLTRDMHAGNEGGALHKTKAPDVSPVDRDVLHAQAGGGGKEGARLAKHP
jgi:hypothetical protein